MSEVDNSTEAAESWFALYVRLRYERVVSDLLRAKGYEAFSPSYVQRRQWRDRVNDVETPLFPGYVFGRFDPRYRLPVLTTPGVREVVGYGRVPVPISLTEIHAIQSAVNSQLRVEPCAYIQAGTRVRIVRGPLAGIEGILEQVKSAYRLIVSVSLIHRSIRVEVDRDMLSVEEAVLGGSEAYLRARMLHCAC